MPGNAVPRGVPSPQPWLRAPLRREREQALPDIQFPGLSPDIFGTSSFSNSRGKKRASSLAHQLTLDSTSNRRRRNAPW